MFLSERGFAKLRGRKIKPATYNLDLNLVRGGASSSLLPLPLDPRFSHRRAGCVRLLVCVDPQHYYTRSSTSSTQTHTHAPAPPPPPDWQLLGLV